ncbi:MAG: GAF domain-containing protein [Anaerolineae bacterium]|nr:GAF domain-containing protein [Anaerolineae bacterium]
MSSILSVLRGSPDAPDHGDILFLLHRRYLQTMLWIGIALAIFVTIYDLLTDAWSPDNYVLAALGLAFIVLAQFVRRGSVVPVGLFLEVTLIGVAFFYPDIRGLIPGMLALITAAVLLDRPLFVLTNVLVIGYPILRLANAYSTNSAESPAFDFWLEISPIISFLIVSVTMRYFNRALQATVQRANRNVALLQASAEVGQISTALLDLNELFSQSVTMIQERFGFYHVQIFMTNGDQAELVASTGEVGRRLLAAKHRLPVGSNSVIGHVTRYGEIITARSTDAVHRFNPMLPDTQTELAVPILEGGKVIGVIDMQSTAPDAFQAADVEALRSMANLLSAAIRNARLFEAQQRSIQEQKRLYLESQTNLSEIQRLNRQLTKAGWEDFVRQSKRGSVGVTLKDEQVVADSQWSDSLIRAAREQQVVTREANGHAGVVAVPVILRGEVIGAIEVEPSAGTIQRDTIETVQAIAHRLATSLENARLFEEAQAATAQEQRINQIVTRYQNAATVDDLLQITLTELSEALGAQRGAIRLGFVPEDGEAVS